MKTVKLDNGPTDVEIAVRALAIWKNDRIPQGLQPQHLEQAKAELETEREADWEYEAALV
ncbi:MAG: hypothetical protein A2107_05975 [Verrucomicrobia bacterium GWF2_62_7]|nr:MAG: hypothetical protein A2107_05975 [Verrucomicrobia bacterium GWF2_62_7]